MTFGGLKENSAAENFENSALTEDSLRLALAKLGAKSDRKGHSSGKPSNPFASGNSRSSNNPTRRKFAQEDSVVVEKLSPRLPVSGFRSVGNVDKVRPLSEEKAVNISAQELQDLKQELADLKQAQKKSEERQKLLEKRLAEMDVVLKRQTQMLMKGEEQLKRLQPSFKKEENQALKTLEVEIFPVTQEKFSDEPAPVKLKEDAAPVEWWKN